MAIYIPRMEMPKYGDTFKVYLDAANNVLLVDISDSSKFYTLIEIPPHGRLIDADALEKEGADIHEDIVHCGYVEDSIWGFSQEKITNAPTIIEAEEK